MYIIIKTDDPENVKITYKGQGEFNYFYSKTLDKKSNQENKIISLNNKRLNKFPFTRDSKVKQEFINYIKQKVLESNKLSEIEIKKLSFEYLKYIYNCQIPEICISQTVTSFPNKNSIFMNQYHMLHDIIDEYTQSDNNRSYNNNLLLSPINARFLKDEGIILPFKSFVYSHSACGALNIHFYKLIYYFEFLDIKIPYKSLKEFWDFYKSTMNIYALQYMQTHNKIYIVPKPDEIYIKNNITHCFYQGYGHYCDGIRVPSWLYKAEKNDLKISDFYNTENADIRSIFVKKAGIEKFIELGLLIDSWENYPDNEWWAKSEYKLLDMKNILIKGRYVRNGQTDSIIRYDYAPFLCMKNQTTGEYHLEGVSPDCRNLYDALKMRYKMLNLPDYEIKEIK